MSEPEPMPMIARLFFLVFFCFWFWMSYLLFARPKQYIEWFLAKPYRPLGVSVVVSNEKKLSRWTRSMGALFLLGGLLMILVMFKVRVSKP